MQYLKTYLNKITTRGNTKLAESILRTAEDVGNTHIRNFSFTSHEIGLLFGNVQSGKTGQMFGIMCKAADLGFSVFILLTTDNVILQQQTLDRVKSDLEGFCICGENDAKIFADNNLLQPAIVVLKKNAKILKLWANIFNSTGFMKGNPLFIVDDEADAASLNTLINQNLKSSINKYLEMIKNCASCSIYLQVTGTPQALFLQTAASGWHPYFTYYFQPGDSYLGGDFFFPTTGKPDCVQYLQELLQPTRSVVLRHIAVSSQIFAMGGKVSNCLIHPSARQAVHEKFAEDVACELAWCAEHRNDDFTSLIEEEYNHLFPAKTDKADLNVFLAKAYELLDSKSIQVLVMNGTTDIDNEEYESGCNFVIGGNTLGRGVTFPSLQTIYYTRTSKTPQADTMWQHSRMFGYDRDPGLMMVFIDENLYKLFSDINATNNSIIAQIERGIDNVKIYYPSGLNPTRKNVLEIDHVEMISGGTNYYPSYPDNNTIEELSGILDPFDDNEPYYQVSLRLVKELLSHIVPSPDFKLNAFISAIDSILAEQPAGQGILIVRRNRDITQGTGALRSPTDWHLGGEFPSKLVLTMYQVTGSKGWGNRPLWIPNIKLPGNIVYYDVDV